MKKINRILDLRRAIKVALIILLIIAIFDLPYYYYEIIRYVGMTFFVILGYTEYERKNKLLMIIWFSFALLINPFATLTIEREIWQIIDIILIAILTLSFIKRKTITDFHKINPKEKIQYLIILIIWSSSGILASSFFKPKTIEYYTSKGFTKSYASQIIFNKNESQIVPIAILIFTIMVVLFIIRRLNNIQRIDENE